MSPPVGDQTDQTMPRQAWRVRFTIRGFILVVALLCAVLSHVLTSVQLHRVRQEARQLRDELGELTVTDERKLHAISLAPDLGYTQKRWRWRLRFPPERYFRVCYKFTGLPAEGVPDDNFEFFTDNLKGELTLTASAVPDPSGVWKFVLHTAPADPRFSQTRTQFITNASWLTEETSMSQFQAGSETTDSVNLGQPMTLLRLRPTKLVPMAGGAPAQAIDPNPTDGIILWIEEMKKR